MPYKPSTFAVLAANDHKAARAKLVKLMAKHQGDVAEVAVALGISRRTAYRYLKKLRIKNRWIEGR